MTNREEKEEQDRYAVHHCKYLIQLNSSPVLWGLVLLACVIYLLGLCALRGLFGFGWTLHSESGLCGLIPKALMALTITQIYLLSDEFLL